MSSEQEKFDSLVSKLEADLTQSFEEKANYVNSFENRVKAMKLLIGKEYIRTPQVQLINALQQGTELDLHNIIQALDIKMGKASQILSKIKELEKGGTD